MTLPACRLVLTGASGALGRAFAVALAPSCSAMVLGGRDSARLQALQQKLDAMHPGLDVHTVQGDLLEPGVIDRLYDAARNFDAPPNLLVNAAGMNDFHAIDEQDATAVVRLLAVNLLAPIRVTQRLLPLLRTARSAQIVNVGSTFGYLGYPGHAVHCATKFGLRGYTQALRRELADTRIAVRHFATSTGNAGTTGRDDHPEGAAEAFLRFLGSDERDSRLGFPERMFVWLDRISPRLGDLAVRQHLSVMRRPVDRQGLRAPPQGRKP